jgi:hypothetical protein
VLFLKLGDQPVQRRVFRHVERRELRVFQPVLGIQQILPDVEETFDVVKLIAIEQQEIALGFAGSPQAVALAVIQVNPDQIHARRHDIAGLQRVQPDDGFDHRQLVRVENALFAADFQDGLELLLAECLAARTEKTLEFLGQFLQHQPQRRGHRDQPRHKGGVKLCQLLREQQANALGPRFAKDDQQHRYHRIEIRRRALETTVPRWCNPPRRLRR